MLSPEKVLSKENQELCIKLLTSNKQSEVFKFKGSSEKAAVLVPLCLWKNQLALLYTVRSLQLKVSGGEVAFPGGRFDSSDSYRTLENTALREAYEEVGIHPSKVEVWCKGPEIQRPGIKITPVLGYIGQINLKQLKVNPNEVSFAFLATLEELSSSNNFRTTRFRFNKNYVYQSPVYLVSNTRIWGLTAFITNTILSSLIPKIYNQNIYYRPIIQKVVKSTKTAVEH